MMGNNNSSSGNGSCYLYDSPDYARVALANAVTATASVVASCFVILLFVLFKKWIFFTQRLIFYLAISSLLNAISQILHRVDYKNQTTQFYTSFCAFGGFLDEVTSWMVLDSMLIITVYLFAIAVLNRNTQWLGILYLFVIFVLPTLIGLFPFIKSSYGRSGAWCWIRVQERKTCEFFPLGVAFMISLWYVPFLIIIIAMIIMYVRILIQLCRNRSNKNWENRNTAETVHLSKENRKKIVSLIIYPAIYFILLLFPLMNRIESSINRMNPSLVLWYLSAIAHPVSGSMIGIAYALDGETRKRLTWPHLKAAFRQWTTRSDLEEYPISQAEGDDRKSEETKPLLNVSSNTGSINT